MPLMLFFVLSFENIITTYSRHYMLLNKNLDIVRYEIFSDIQEYPSSALPMCVILNVLIFSGPFLRAVPSAPFVQTVCHMFSSYSLVFHHDRGSKR